jgi:hypothetical protein
MKARALDTNPATIVRASCTWWPHFCHGWNPGNNSERLKTSLAKEELLACYLFQAIKTAIAQDGKYCFISLWQINHWTYCRMLTHCSRGLEKQDKCDPKDLLFEVFKWPTGVNPQEHFFLVSPTTQRAVVLISFPRQCLGDHSFYNLNLFAFTCA